MAQVQPEKTAVTISNAVALCANVVLANMGTSLAETLEGEVLGKGEITGLVVAKLSKHIAHKLG